MSLISVSPDVFAQLCERRECGDRNTEDTLRRLLELPPFVGDETPAQQSAVIDNAPGLSESLLRAGHWCQSTVCPKQAQTAAVTDDPSGKVIPLARVGHWCESTTCPLA
jgi:hypothetical protein